MQLTSLDQFLADSPHQSIHDCTRLRGRGNICSPGRRDLTPRYFSNPSASKQDAGLSPSPTTFPLPANCKNKAVLFFNNLLSHLLKVFPINLLYLPYADVFSLTEGPAICCHHGLGRPSVPGVINRPSFCSQQGLFPTHTSQ